MIDFKTIQRDWLTTEEFALAVGVKANTIRRGLSVNGNYMGVVPCKLPNRLLRWAVDDVKKIWEGGKA